MATVIIMEGFEVTTVEEALAEGDIYVTTTGNRDIIRIEHIEKMKSAAIICNIGHFDNEIQVDKLKTFPGIRHENIKPQVDKYIFPDGHAKALITIENPAKQISIYEEILANHLSVRKVEEMVRANEETSSPVSETIPAKKATTTPAEHALIQNRLSERLQSKVQFSCNDKGKGKITINFSSDAELERLMDLFDKLS